MKHSYTPEGLRSKTDQQLQNLLANARRLDAQDVVQMVQEELAQRIYGDDLPKAVSAKLEAAIVAYEKSKAEEKGTKNFRATRTRQALARHGMKAAVERIVTKGESMGFHALPFESTFERVILDHVEHFSSQAVEAAKARQKGSRN